MSSLLSDEGDIDRLSILMTRMIDVIASNIGIIHNAIKRTSLLKMKFKGGVASGYYIDPVQRRLRL
ncbi:MAG: hypothetical protein ACXADF_08710 [Candidatus Thorarchaeota archaeon]